MGHKDTAVGNAGDDVLGVQGGKGLPEGVPGDAKGLAEGLLGELGAGGQLAGGDTLPELAETQSPVSACLAPRASALEFRQAPP